MVHVPLLMASNQAMDLSLPCRAIVKPSNCRSRSSRVKNGGVKKPLRTPKCRTNQSEQPPGALDVAAGDQRSLPAKNPVHLRCCALLVGEGVPAVHREHHIHAGVSHRQVGGIGLEKMDIVHALFLKAGLGLAQHVHRAVHPDDRGLGVTAVEGGGEDSRAHRHVQQNAVESVRQERQDLLHRVAVARASPDDPAEDLRRDRGGGDTGIVSCRHLVVGSGDPVVRVGQKSTMPSITG